jgi:hypothetical protein
MASGKSKVIDVDRGFAELRKTLASIAGRGTYVKVGVIGDAAGEKHESGSRLSNVDVATINEFGTSTIPARPFIGSTFDLNRERYVKTLAKALGKVYENKLTVDRALGLVGTQMATDTKKRVLSRDNNFAPNAPSTMRQKMAKSDRNRPDIVGPLESPRPLVDTGRMVASVSYEVVHDDTDKAAQGYSEPSVHETEVADDAGARND